MRKYFAYLFLVAVHNHGYAQKTLMQFPQLQQPVEIMTDKWGVAHIYAKNEQDLFFAQGYQAAKDRLYQFEIFRRKATGTMAEVLGKRELKRDIGARLFKFRGDMDAELSHYHPRGKAIIQAFVNGINAYIKQIKNAEMPMPLELKLLGINPGYWTPSIVVSRHNGLLSNVQDELATARLLQQIGEQNLLAVSNFQPLTPDLKIDTPVVAERLSDDVLGLYNAFRAPLVFEAEDIRYGSREIGADSSLAAQFSEPHFLYKQQEGSNNWVVAGAKSASGFPLLANDPHRAIATPSLRYMVHLDAPGWHVIGGGEPILPGVSIGHNDFGAWGLTIFETDAEDLFVYKLNPDNPNQYFYKGHWKNFTKIVETITIKNKPAEKVSLYYSIHGPVTFIDSLHHLAYAVKCGWLEKGCAPYLASLRMDQAKNLNEFKTACAYSYIPAENMVWADKQGHIMWQAVGITPIRKKHSGMVPVPGDGRYDWDGYLPILKRPGAIDPGVGFIATANENNVGREYPYMNTIGFTWADAFRHNRIAEVLGKNNKITVNDMGILQSDYFSMPARSIVPLLAGISSNNPDFKLAKTVLENWDMYLNPGSVSASIYVAWEQYLKENFVKEILHTQEKHELIDLSIEKMIAYLLRPKSPGNSTIFLNDSLLQQSLVQAIVMLRENFGSDSSNWKYGQLKRKHVWIKHPLSGFVNDSLQSLMDAGPVLRGGDENTVNSTGSSMNQHSGASFRVLIDCADWDLMKAINCPGQNGNSGTSHYKDLFNYWAANAYFPLYFSRKKVNEVLEQKILLQPGLKK
jgi:penicillin amidase